MSADKSSRRFHLHHCFRCFSCFICSQEKLKQQVFRWLHLWWRVNISTQRALPESQALQYYPRQLQHIHQISSDIRSIFQHFQPTANPNLSHVEYQTKATARSLGKFQRQVAEAQTFSNLSTSNPIEMNMDHVQLGHQHQVLLLERDHMGGHCDTWTTPSWNRESFWEILLQPGLLPRYQDLFTSKDFPEEMFLISKSAH